MKRYVLIILAFAMILNMGCGGTEKQPEEDSSGSLKIYFVDINEMTVVSEPFVSNSDSDEELVGELIGALSIMSKEKSYVNAKPAGVEINSYYLDKNKILTIDFSASYYRELTGTSEILSRAAIVKTLCQSSGVKYVEFTVQGQPLVINDTVMGRMRSTDFIDTAGESTEYALDTHLTVYFANTDGTMLTESRLVVSSDGSHTMEKLVFEQLVYGPLDGQNHLLRTFPETVSLNSVETVDGVCTIDLSPDFLLGMEGITPMVSVYSVVNSICEITGINKVRFLFDGEQKKNVNGIDFSEQFERNLSLLENETVTEKTGGIN